MVTIVADAGSTWVNKKEYAKELIRVGKEIGLDCVKFQLFPNQPPYVPPNVYLSPELFKELFMYGKSIGMPVAASAFDRASVDFLSALDVHHIKFAYSQRKADEIVGMLNVGKKVVVSTNVQDAHDLPKFENLIKLQVTPYPWEVAPGKVDMEGLFPPMEGLSDHSLGIGQSLEAVRNGATWLERHMTLGYSDCLSVPDGRFALQPKKLEELVRSVK